MTLDHVLNLSGASGFSLTSKCHDAVGSKPCISVLFTFVLYLLFLLSGSQGSPFSYGYPLKSSLMRGLEDLMPPHTWLVQLASRSKGAGVSQGFGDGIWGDPGFAVYGQWHHAKNTRP